MPGPDGQDPGENMAACGFSRQGAEESLRVWSQTSPTNSRGRGQRLFPATVAVKTVAKIQKDQTPLLCPELKQREQRSPHADQQQPEGGAGAASQLSGCNVGEKSSGLSAPVRALSLI